MKVDTILNYALLDRLINKDVAFLLFKEPQSPHPSLAVFSASSVHYHARELDGKSGYVFAPFEPNEDHPIVLLSESTLYTGNDSINAYLAKTTDCAISEKGPSALSIPAFESVSTSNIKYESAFEACHKAVVEGECQKIVLSRKHVAKRPSDFSPARLFAAACDAYTEAYVYLFHAPISGTWLGSTPEALLLGDGEAWQTVALAGTQPSDTPTGTVWDAKNCMEQQIVSDYVERALQEWGIKAEKKGPYSIKAGQLVHLKTTFQFELTAPMENRLGTLVDVLHPTPATCGFPKEKAMRLIRQHEGHDRSYYCGYVGRIREHGFTHLFVNLRCMCILPDCLVLYAGGGIMAESSCESEWEETESKLHTLLSLLA